MKQEGLERNRWIEPLEEFVRQHGRATPRWAIFLSYEFDPARFTRSVLPSLSHQGRCFRTVVLADQGALEKSLVRSRLESLGSLNLHPVRCRRGGVFHPKLVFLRAGSNLRACFGSANLTGGGLGSNLELWSFTESHEVLGGLAKFLEALVNSPEIAFDDGARRSVRQALAGLAVAETNSVWSSLQGSFAHHIKNGPESRASEVIAISPMFAGKEGVQGARRAIPCKQFRLYTNEPISLPDCKELFVYSPQDTSNKADADEELPATSLHAKAYVFSSNPSGTALAWLGSANFTTRALTKSVKSSGNVELMVRTRLPKDEVDALQADLKELFKKAKPQTAGSKRKEIPPRPAATVLACELRGRPGNWRLIVQATQRDGFVLLRNGKQRIRIQIRKGRGIANGVKLERLIPQLADPGAPQVLMLFQVLKNGTEVPVVVNIPHVPPDGNDGEDPHVRLNWLLDELIGRIPVVHPRSDSADIVSEDASDLGEDLEIDSENDDLERRLDLVCHQGEIDQLAVKTALLKKLATRISSGDRSNRLLGEYAKILLAATPNHLKHAVKAYLGV